MRQGIENTINIEEIVNSCGTKTESSDPNYILIYARKKKFKIHKKVVLNKLH